MDSESNQSYVPVWENSVFQKWCYRFCLDNNWRVRERLGDFDDCMAQCAFYFLACKKFYEGKINSPAHFMYLFRLWVTGQFHDLSVKDYRDRCTKPQYVCNDSIKSEVELSVSLSEASSELKEVLKVFFSAPQEILETLRADAKTAHSLKFFRHVISFCGFPEEKSDVISNELRDMLMNRSKFETVAEDEHYVTQLRAFLREQPCDKCKTISSKKNLTLKFGSAETQGKFFDEFRLWLLQK